MMKHAHTPVEYARAIRSLQNTVKGLTNALNLAHSVNVSLLHRMGGQVVFCTGEMQALNQDFPFVTIETEPGFISLKLRSEIPEIPQVPS